MATAVGNSATATVVSRAASTRSLPCALLIGLVFLLPHLVRIARLGSYREYTPFSVTTVSNVVWDESFLYGAQANTMLQQHRRADDTDSWEHRDSFFPYSILPLSAEVAVAEVMAPGRPREGLKRAQILFHFVFPCLMGWLLMELFDICGVPVSISAALALLVMVSAFSARTLMAGFLDTFVRQSGDAIGTTLQASRNPNPGVSFVLLLCAMHLLMRAFCTPRRRSFVLAGIVGSLLFYAYPFHAVAWTVACFLLAMLSWWPAAGIPRRSGYTLLATAIGAVPYFLWTHASRVSGAYTQRMLRLGMYYSHKISPAAAHLTELWSVTLLALLTGWLLMRRSLPSSPHRDRTHAAVVITTAVGFGGIAGLDLQVVTGFNIQAEFHYTHMVIQPAAAMLVCLLIATLLARTTVRPLLGRIAFAGLLLACAAAQIDAATHTAPFHKLDPADKALFDWLDAHTAPGDVVATTNLRLCIEMPLYTRNRLLFVNGTRSPGTDLELLDRLLLTDRLAGVSMPRLISQLRHDDPVPDGVHQAGYGSYLAVQRPFMDLGAESLTEPAIATAAERFQNMDVAQQLRRFRVNYVYAEGQDSPVAPVGWTLMPVLRTENGMLWRLSAQR